MPAIKCGIDFEKEIAVSVDSFRAARFYRQIQKKAKKKAVLDPHLPHEVKQMEVLDPSLTNRLVYGNRSDWYVAAAVNGFFDVRVPVKTGNRRYPTPAEIVDADNVSTRKKPDGMNLY